jgi:hypothetical protein
MTTNKEGTHTPMPWTFDSCKTVRLLSLDHKIEIGSLWLKTEQAEKDAAFIVRAVNAHEELVAALKELHTGHEEKGDGYPCGYCDLIAKASA